MNEVNELSKGVIGKKEIERKVRESVVRVHNLEVQPDSLPDNISDLDSVKVVELVVKLEETFGIMMDDNELVAANYETVSKVVDMIYGKLGG